MPSDFSFQTVRIRSSSGCTRGAASHHREGDRYQSPGPTKLGHRNHECTRDVLWLTRNGWVDSIASRVNKTGAAPPFVASRQQTVPVAVVKMLQDAALNHTDRKVTRLFRRCASKSHNCTPKTLWLR